MRRMGASLRGIAMATVAFAVACGGQKSVGPVAVSTVLPPANPQAVVKMVQGVTAAKDPQSRDRAIQLLREAIVIDPNLWEARYDLGIILANSGDLAGAEDSLAEAAKSNRDAQDVALALAQVRQRRGEHKAAAEAMGDFVDTHPNAVDVRTLYVASLRDAGQVEKAIAQAREVLVRKPGDASALAELALCHLARGEKDTASLLAKQALDSNPHSAVAERATGLIALAGGDDAIAFQAFLKATQEDPRDTTARLNMGGVLLHAGAYVKAGEQFRAILQVSPEDNDAALGLAAALRGEGGPTKVEEARQILERILDRNPHSVGALFNLGVLYTDVLKRPADARPLFKRFLAEAPADHPSRPDAEHYMAAIDAPTGAGVASGTGATPSPAAVTTPTPSPAPTATPSPAPAKKTGGKS
jgi:tetratricopeptide (TPR) repeat protein